MENPNPSKSLSIIKDDTINTNVTDISKLPSETSNTHLIKSVNLQQHSNPTISSAQETICASRAKQNEIIKLVTGGCESWFWTWGWLFFSKFLSDDDRGMVLDRYKMYCLLMKMYLMIVITALSEGGAQRKKI